MYVFNLPDIWDKIVDDIVAVNFHAANSAVVEVCLRKKRGRSYLISCGIYTTECMLGLTKCELMLVPLNQVWVYDKYFIRKIQGKIPIRKVDHIPQVAKPTSVLGLYQVPKGWVVAI